jgi:hypothetical protein
MLLIIDEGEDFLNRAINGDVFFDLNHSVKLLCC